LFCQVVGWKYIRLYPPDERERLYPRGSDENGVDGSNTSSVDVQILRPMIWRGEEGDRGEEWRCDRKQHEEEFPLAEDAEYVEAMLGPGDSIYVPLGWWHYVESLTTSFSVSFWWI
jgi:lysine-specific demethylase 8